MFIFRQGECADVCVCCRYDFMVIKMSHLLESLLCCCWVVEMVEVFELYFKIIYHYYESQRLIPVIIFDSQPPVIDLPYKDRAHPAMLCISLSSSPSPFPFPPPKPSLSSPLLFSFSLLILILLSDKRKKVQCSGATCKCMMTCR